MDDDTPVVAAPEPSAEDTSEAAVTPNETSVQENDEAPEAIQTEEKTSEVKATDTAEEKLFAGKYKTVEEMEKAYQVLNSKFTTTTQEKAELSRILSEAFASPEPSPAPVTNDDDLFNDEPTQQSPVDNGVSRDLAVMKFIMTHDDADGETLKTVLSTDPIVAQIDGYDAKLEYAYLKSQTLAHSKAVEQVKEQATQAAQSKIVEKQVAQVESASKTEKIDEKVELRNKFNTGNPDERAAARTEYLKKYVL